jgi:tetratricopeptide (TPR) repeat protein
MLSTLAPSPTDVAIREGITDASPLVRRAAARALANSDSATTATALAPLLSDPVRAVRLETAEALAGLPAEDFSASDADVLARSTDEYIAAQLLNADRPEAHLDLGLLYAREKHFDRAEAELKTALSLDPAFTPAAVNLADLYRSQGRDAEGQQILVEAIRRSPGDASLQYTLGLLMVRQKEDQKALALFAAATRLDPANARYAYVYAIALNDSGQTGAAIDTLERNLTQHPYDRHSLAALVSICDRAGKPALALTYAQRLYALYPEDQQLRETISTLTDNINR